MAGSGRSVFKQTSDEGSPLKARPLRNPGQSVDEALDRIVDDKLMFYALLPAFFWALAMIEWVAKWRALPRSPALYALTAAGLTVWSLWRLLRLRRIMS